MYKTLIVKTRMPRLQKQKLQEPSIYCVSREEYLNFAKKMSRKDLERAYARASSNEDFLGNQIGKLKQLANTLGGYRCSKR